jgi:hypothetical protein
MDTRNLASIGSRLEMPRLTIFVAVALLLGVSMSCSQSDAPVVIHVFRDIHASFVEELKRADLQFGTTQRRVKSGKPVIVATNEGTSFQFLLTQFEESVPEVVIFDSQANIPFDPAVRSRLAKAELVCGQHPSFIPTSISGEKREAAEMYVRFLVSQCATSVTNFPAPVDTQAIAKADAARKDPHRPACVNARCRKIKKFLKAHYCGESPAGNGPDDGCELRSPQKRTLAAKVIADFDCAWIESEAKSKCHQKTPPALAIRSMLIRELQRVGLPAQREAGIYFTVLKSPSLGWLLATANYSHAVGSDLMLCKVLALIDPDGNLQVLRKLAFQKTDADVPNVTSWFPIDIADVDGDGRLEIVLGGDAYEDHWIEVVSIENASFTTIFSGLGYYL